MKRIKRAVTIHDVAKAAGVSISTVSRVLNNKDYVAPETYEQVQAVIKEMGYASSLAARSMRSRKTGVIGLVVPDVGDPFQIQVMRGINRAIAEFDRDLIVYTGGDFTKEASADRERYFVSLLNGSITDGMIIVTPAANDFSSVSPVVAVDPNSHNSDYPAVIATNYAGVLEAMEYLIGLGHRRIGFIGGRPELQSAVQRLQGYKDGLQQAGIPVDPDLIQPGDYRRETGSACAERLLGLPSPPTAIFGANDQSAIGAIEAARKAGLGVPDDVSVVGFDNIPEAAYMNPGLTTVDQFIDQMGYVATEMLVRLIQGEDLDRELYEMPTELVVRGSCRSL